LGLLSLVAGELTWPSLRALAWMIGGSFFGPFLSYILFFRGLRTVDLSQATIIQASQPLFVAFYSFILFGSLIGLAQFAGGLVVLSGILMILLPNSRFRHRRKLSAQPEFRPTISHSIQADRPTELPGHQE
jgi:drug/metabolite transporter (DMT)-like permease